MICVTRSLRLVIIQHTNELRRTSTSTSHLLQEHMNISYMTWSGRVDNDILESKLHAFPKLTLVWPSSSQNGQQTVEENGAYSTSIGTQSLKENLGESDKTYCILDGTWEEAEKVFRKGPQSLRALSHHSLAPLTPSIYKLRKNFGYQKKYGLQTSNNLLCTAEVGAQLLREQGEEAKANSVIEALHIFQSPRKSTPPKLDHREVQPKESFVYMLQSTSGSTYIGATVNLAHRLRQHNGEITGGARTTARLVKLGDSWRRICYVKNFPSWSAALQFEWRWKKLTRRSPVRLSTLERRKAALTTLLALDRATANAAPFCDWIEPPEVVWEEEEEWPFAVEGADLGDLT